MSPPLRRSLPAVLLLVALLVGGMLAMRSPRPPSLSAAPDAWQPLEPGLGRIRWADTPGDLLIAPPPLPPWAAAEFPIRKGLPAREPLGASFGSLPADDS